MTLAFSLADSPEFDRIRAIARALGSAATRLGDDCALIPFERETLVLSTDVSVEDVHFRTTWLSLPEIGWRATASALSDLAAEGADAIGVLVALTAPSSASDTDVVALMSGVGDAAKASGGTVLGGDLSSGTAWSVAVTVVGRAAAPVTRAGAVPGDGLWVTGMLGGARAALELWQRGETPSETARSAFARPVPRIDGGRWLAHHGAHAMLDLSDGLAGDAPHLAAASNVALTITLDALPLAPDADAYARRMALAPERFCAEGGEDYELLVALPARFDKSDADRFYDDCNILLTRIGTVAEGSGVRFQLGGQDLDVRGFDHFR